MCVFTRKFASRRLENYNKISMVENVFRLDTCTGNRNQWNIKTRILKMYSRSAKGGEKGDPNRNPWLAKMVLPEHMSSPWLLVRFMFLKSVVFCVVFSRSLFFCLFSFGHYIVCPSNYVFWLPFLFLETFLV